MELGDPLVHATRMFLIVLQALSIVAMLIAKNFLAALAWGNSLMWYCMYLGAKKNGKITKSERTKEY